jgi:hypothetical protein
MKSIEKFEMMAEAAILGSSQLDSDPQRDYRIHRDALLCSKRIDETFIKNKMKNKISSMVELERNRIETAIVEALKNKMVAELKAKTGIDLKILKVDVENRKALAITRDCVAQMPYHHMEGKSITWEKCTLRQWLNHEYFGSLSPDIRGRICEAWLSNKDNPDYGTKGGQDTADKVFLLSIEEARLYFADDKERIAYYEGEKAWWWLRSPGNYGGSAAYVHSVGSLYTIGYFVDNEYGGVRPAFWLNL